MLAMRLITSPTFFLASSMMLSICTFSFDRGHFGLQVFMVYHKLCWNYFVLAFFIFGFYLFGCYVAIACQCCKFFMYQHCQIVGCTHGLFFNDQILTHVDLFLVVLLGLCFKASLVRSVLYRKQVNAGPNYMLELCIMRGKSLFHVKVKL